MKNAAWVRTPVDAFILHRLEREGLRPSPEADRVTLIRRLSADLKLERLVFNNRRAVMIEGGMQNSGLALGIIAVQFGSDLGMVIIASLWGIWHIVSGLGLAILWRMKDARLAR